MSLFSSEFKCKPQNKFSFIAIYSNVDGEMRGLILSADQDLLDLLELDSISTTDFLEYEIENPSQPGIYKWVGYIRESFSYAEGVYEAYFTGTWSLLSSLPTF